MSDEGEIFRAYSEERKQKRQSNLKQSLKNLENNGIEYIQKSDSHFIVGEFDFYPTTGLFINRISNKKGRGVFNLIKKTKTKTKIL